MIEKFSTIILCIFNMFISQLVAFVHLDVSVQISFPLSVVVIGLINYNFNLWVAESADNWTLQTSHISVHGRNFVTRKAAPIYMTAV